MQSRAVGEREARGVPMTDWEIIGLCAGLSLFAACVLLWLWERA